MQWNCQPLQSVNSSISGAGLSGGALTKLHLKLVQSTLAEADESAKADCEPVANVSENKASKAVSLKVVMYKSLINIIRYKAMRLF